MCDRIRISIYYFIGVPGIIILWFCYRIRITLKLLNTFHDPFVKFTQLLPFELFSKKFCLKISELGLEIV